MISIRNLTFSYPGAERPSLVDVNLEVGEGECVLLAGPSGCGKSTLCLTMNGIIPHMIRGEFLGRVTVGGMDTSIHSIPELAQKVGLVFQNPDNQLFALTVEEDIAFGPENLGLSREEIQKRIAYGLARTNMENLREKFVYNLSGGQKQRTAIAGILAMNPEILVFDEPTSDLDPQGTEEVLNTIRELNRKEGRTILIVEHKSKQVLPLCDRILWMENGHILAEYDPNGKIPEPLRHGYRRDIPRHVNHHDPGYNENIIAVNSLVHTYPDGTTALRGVTLSIKRGEIVAVVGANGSGKSTLAMHFNGLLLPTSGTVVVCGKDTRMAGNGSLASTVGYLFQNPDHQIFAETVFEEVEIALKHRGISTELRERKVYEAIAAVGLMHCKDRDPNTLSRGERQRLAVATVFALEPQILIFDEPTTGQDPVNIREIMAFIERISQEGKTIVIVTHDMEIAWSYADRIIVMDAGRIVCETPTSIESESVPPMFRRPGCFTCHEYHEKGGLFA